MVVVGETLRQERLRRNLGLEQISRELKISTRFLDAIENEQFGKLPGLIFAKSFVRQYARYLDLDDAEMAAEVQHILEPEPQALAGERPEPIAVGAPLLREYGDRQLSWRSLLPSAALVVLVVLVSSGVYVFWQQARTRTAPEAEPGQLAIQAPQTEQARSVAPASAESAPTAESAQLRSEADRVQSLSPAPSPQEQPPSTERAVTELTAAAGGEPDPSAPVRLKLTAQEPVWVRASNNGKYLFSETLDANQTRELDGAGQMELVLGNAGGIVIEVNGKSVGEIGPKGQVRTVHINSGGFTIVPRKPAAPLDFF